MLIRATEQLTVLVDFSAQPSGACWMHVQLGGVLGRAIAEVVGGPVAFDLTQGDFDRIRNAFDEFRTRQR